MAEDPPEQTGRERRTGAPAGYGASPGPQGPPLPPSPTAPLPAAPPAPGPVYGRVLRYGQVADGPPLPPTAGAPGVQAPYGPPPGPWSPPGAPTAPVGPAVPATWWPVPPGPGSWAPRPSRDDHASWLRRAAGLALDRVPIWIAAIVLVAGYVPLYAGLLRGDFRPVPTSGLVLVGMLLYLAAFAFDVWNRWFLAGRTGQSVGRRVTGTWLVGQQSGRPVGVLAAFVRDLLHVLDSMSYVGYLWPLWDDERQTFADKVVQTVVVRTRVEPLAPGEPRLLVA